MKKVFLLLRSHSGPWRHKLVARSISAFGSDVRPPVAAASLGWCPAQFFLQQGRSLWQRGLRVKFSVGSSASPLPFSPLDRLGVLFLQQPSRIGYGVSWPVLNLSACEANTHSIGSKSASLAASCLHRHRISCPHPNWMSKEGNGCRFVFWWCFSGCRSIEYGAVCEYNCFIWETRELHLESIGIQINIWTRFAFISWSAQETKRKQAKKLTMEAIGWKNRAKLLVLVVWHLIVVASTWHASDAHRHHLLQFHQFFQFSFWFGCRLSTSSCQSTSSLCRSAFAYSSLESFILFFQRFRRAGLKTNKFQLN